MSAFLGRHAALHQVELRRLVSPPRQPFQRQVVAPAKPPAAQAIPRLPLPQVLIQAEERLLRHILAVVFAQPQRTQIAQ